MNTSTLLITAAVGHLLAVASPGPDFAVVTRQSLAFGRAAGVATAAGIATGIVFHVGYALFGLGWLLQQWPWLVELLRYAGAAFLLWMGVNALRAQSQNADTAVAATAPRRASQKDFAVGLATNLLNPKATLFFVALCSSLLTAEPAWQYKLGLAAWIIGTTFLWFCLVAYLLSSQGLRGRLIAHAHWIDRGMGAVLVALAVLMLVPKA
jgi:RhtB (resistance to homoserine/threonine) family protein